MYKSLDCTGRFFKVQALEYVNSFDQVHLSVSSGPSQQAEIGQ